MEPLTLASAPVDAHALASKQVVLRSALVFCSSRIKVVMQRTSTGIALDPRPQQTVEPRILRGRRDFPQAASLHACMPAQVGSVSLQQSVAMQDTDASGWVNNSYETTNKSVHQNFSATFPAAGTEVAYACACAIRV
jgi:hypothetical protein